MDKVLTLKDKEDIANLIEEYGRDFTGNLQFSELVFDCMISVVKYSLKEIAKTSKDPNTKVGAAVISHGMGAFGVNTDSNIEDIPWDKREGSYFETKYPYVTHAEINAISRYLKLVPDIPINKAILFVTLFPCHECAKVVSALGIKYVLYMDDKYDGTDGNRIAKELLDANGVKYFKI